MFELSQIILWILWRLRPVTAVEANLADIIATGFAMFGDETDLALMEDNPDHCAMILAGIADANTKLDLLIYLRACEILGIRSRAKDFKANRIATRSGRTPQECWARFRRLVIRFQDYERLAQRRAERLRLEQSPLRLDASHRSTSPAFHAVEDSAILLEVLPRRRRGRWIARACAQDGGGEARSAQRTNWSGGPIRATNARSASAGPGAFPRGPPSPSSSDFRNTTSQAPPARTHPRVCHNPYRRVYEKLPQTPLRKAQKENTTGNKNGART